MLTSFQDFLRSEFSDENVEFWLACEEYRSSGSADDLRRSAGSIYETFIQQTACREVSATNCPCLSPGQAKSPFLWGDCFNALTLNALLMFM